MQVKVLLFASARDRIGHSTLSYDLPSGSTIEGLRSRLMKDYPAASGVLSVCRFSMEEEYVEAPTALKDGVEIGVIPPVSGGAGSVILSEIVRSPIDVAGLAGRVSSGGCGAVLTFAGTVRSDDDGRRRVVRIEYEGYEGMASRVLSSIAAAAAAKGARVAVEHRLGVLEVGEVSVAIAVASEHRNEGFQILREIIESIKRELPIWKREQYSDGSSEWVSCQSHSESCKNH